MHSRLRRRRRQRKPGRPTVTIEVRRHLARVAADALSGIRHELEIPRIRTTWSEDGGLQQRPERLCLYEARDGYVYFHAGLTSRVRRQLQGQNQIVVVRDRTLWTQFSRTDDSLLHNSPLLPFQVELLVAIDRKSRGQILLQTMSDGVLVLDALEQYYPQENILVVAKNKETAARIAQRLHTRTGRTATWGAGFTWVDRPKLHVTSMASFAGRNVTDWSVVVLADAESARSQTAIQQLICMDNSLRFALLPAGQDFDRDDQLHLEAFYGPEIYRLDDQPPCDTRVTVLYAGPCSYPAARPADPLQRKRDYIWHNPHRNRQIANTAQALRNRDRRALQHYGIEISDRLDGFKQDGQPSVLVLVELPEHGRALQTHLPDWPLLDADGMDEPDLDFPLGAYQDVQKGIVTRLRANQAGVSADVIIRAEGTGTGWNTDLGPHFLLSGPQMLVVDVRDDFDDRARQDVQRRLAAYQEREFHVIDPPATAVNPNSPGGQVTGSLSHHEAVGQDR